MVITITLIWTRCEHGLHSGDFVIVKLKTNKREGKFLTNNNYNICKEENICCEMGPKQMGA